MKLSQIAWKFMLRGTEQGRFSLMTFVSWVAIAVGVAAMCCLLSVMYGFEGALRDRFLNVYPHVIIKSKTASESISDYAGWTEKVRALEGVQRVLPYIETEMILQASTRTLGGVVWGIEYNDLERLQSGLVEGRLPKKDADISEILMGRELGHRLGAYAGSKINIISPLRRSGAFGMAPEAETFIVSGLYASGHYETDQQFVYLALEDVQDLAQMDNRITGWHVWGTSVDDSEAVQKQIAVILPEPWKAESWRVFNSALFESLRLEQYAMFSVLCFAVFIAVLNIVITLLMHVTHKRRNIGILSALGASKEQIQRIFLWQGLWMGGVGLASGGILAAVLLIYLKYFSTFELPEIYYDRSIPVEIRPLSIAVICGVAVIFVFLATIFPARRAAQVDPIAAIRE